MKTYKAKISKEGQITIPLECRKRLKLDKDKVMTLYIDGDTLYMQPPRDMGGEDLFGAWKDMTDAEAKRFRASWRDLDDKVPS